MTKREAKWKAKYVEQLEKMSLRNLIQEAVQSARGDDYDGTFTENGEWEFFKVLEYLNRRLDEAGIEGPEIDQYGAT